jgi:hypothetical protein
MSADYARKNNADYALHAPYSCGIISLSLSLSLSLLCIYSPESPVLRDRSVHKQTQPDVSGGTAATSAVHVTTMHYLPLLTGYVGTVLGAVAQKRCTLAYKPSCFTVSKYGCPEKNTVFSLAVLTNVIYTAHMI